MSDLTDFLLARIAEDEAGAKCIETITYHDRWITYPNGEVKRVLPPAAVTTLPERVLAECEAKRRIVAEHEGTVHRCVGGDYTWCDEDCATKIALALPYADHPDYREEWKP